MQFGKRLYRFFHLVKKYPLPTSIHTEFDIPVTIRDGKKLFANIYSPKQPGKYPVILSIAPYGKDDFKGKHGYSTFRWLVLFLGYDVGDITISDHTPFEATDPGFWVPHGYVVIHVDARGSHHSEGNLSVFSMQDRQDYHDLIEWAGTQSWSNGNVGLCGVSYLAISQWFAATQKPAHLKAIIPWEGLTDLYRDIIFHGGIPETKFTTFWAKDLYRVLNTRYKLADDIILRQKTDILYNDFWQERKVDFNQIDVPALVCASWSDHGLHTRGSFLGFTQIKSKEKWLFNHGRQKWAAFYMQEALNTQLKFFDHYLKGIDNSWQQTPKVRYEIRKNLNQFTVHYAEAWPIPETFYQPFYLGDKTLQHAPLQQEKSVSYHSETGSVTFNFKFLEDLAIVGNMKLKLWISAEDTDDFDLFVGIKKFDSNNKEITFHGFSANPNDIVAKGWLRGSHRTLDVMQSTDTLPVLSHTKIDMPLKGKIVPVEIEILPSGTLFETGSQLRLVVQGKDIVKHPAMGHDKTINQGIHRIHFGGRYDSHLLVPILKEKLQNP